MTLSRRALLAGGAGALAAGAASRAVGATGGEDHFSGVWRPLPTSPGHPAATGPEAPLWVPTLGANLAPGPWVTLGSAVRDGDHYLLGHERGQLDTLLSEPVELAAGTTFSISCEMATQEFPGQHLRIGAQVLRDGAWENLRGLSGAVGQAGRWEEKVATFVMPAGATAVQAKFLAPGQGPGQLPITVRDLHLQTGLGFRRSPARKSEYHGAHASIDRDGTWRINGEPTFLTMMYASSERDYNVYRDAGWNTISNVETVGQLEQTAAADMYAMLSVSPWAWSRGWAANGTPEQAVERLTTTLTAMEATGELDRIIGIYWDNEDDDAIGLNTAVLRAVRELLPGRPRWMLRGQYPTTPETGTLDLAEAVGTYVGAENTGGAGGSVSGLAVLDSLPHQTLPVSVAQVQFSNDVLDRVLNGVGQGAKAVSFWRDGDAFDVTSTSWWANSASVLEEAARLALPPT